MPKRLAILILPVLAVLATIFALAQQDVRGTQDLAWRAERLLVRLVPPTGTGSIGEPTWCGLTIRRIAHIVEFAALGLVAVLVARQLPVATTPAHMAVLGLCLAASLADEVHKHFVPGRHFDPADLLLDALGYGVVILVSLALSAVLG